MAELTAERLRELLDYDPDTGVFKWTKTRGAAVRGGEAGSTYRGKTGYCCRVIRVEYEIYQAHRLAWFYVYGQWPSDEIDHIDGNAMNNKIANLRDVPSAVNSQNMRKPMPFNKTGLIGVSFDAARGKFRACISIKNKAMTLGRFDTPEAAHAAYIAAKRKLHEGCTI